MAKLVIFLSILIVGCTGSSPVMYVMTGHENQKQMIDATFQHALEHNPDGVVSAWNDDTADKSGYINDESNRCRHCGRWLRGYVCPISNASGQL